MADSVEAVVDCRGLVEAVFWTSLEAAHPTAHATVIKAVPILDRACTLL